MVNGKTGWMPQRRLKTTWEAVQFCGRPDEYIPGFVALNNLDERQVGLSTLEERWLKKVGAEYGMSSDYLLNS
jgi:hypothetical protein